jgi:hypothetical protein
MAMGEMEVQVADWCAHIEEVEAELSIRASERLLNATDRVPNATAAPAVPKGEIVEGIFKIASSFDTVRSDTIAFGELFRGSVSGALGFPRSRLQVLTVREGSIIISFQIQPGEGESGLRLIELWRRQLQDVNSTLMRDPSFGGFAERGSLMIVPLADQFEHAPLTRSQLAELQRMGGMDFLEAACIPGLETRPLEGLDALLRAVATSALVQAVVLACTLTCAWQQCQAKSEGHPPRFVELAQPSEASSEPDSP